MNLKWINFIYSCDPVLFLSFFCFVSLFYLWVPGLSPLLFSLISSLIYILSLAQFYALEDVLSTEYNPGLLCNQKILWGHTHTQVCAHAYAHQIYLCTHNIYFKIILYTVHEHNHKGNKHSPTRSNKSVQNAHTDKHTHTGTGTRTDTHTHTHTHVIPPEGSNSSESFTCVLCADTRQQHLDSAQHRQKNWVFCLTKTRHSFWNIPTIPWLLLDLQSPGVSYTYHKFCFIYHITRPPEHTNDRVPHSSR